ncbi:MAG: N-acetyltransferase family protein [Candidatus Acetothermia bacterium]
MKAKIRRFQNGDGEEIRNIAAATATGYPRQTRLIGHLLTDYYLHYEPEHLLVAESQTEIVGYLCGCFDSQRCRRIKATKVIPAAVVSGVFRGDVGWKEIRYFCSFLYLSIRGVSRNSPPRRYPAHFHINLRRGWRGKGIGTRLARTFFSMLEEAGIRGVHVRVRQDDMKANQFFRSLGFSRENGYPILVHGKGKLRTSRSAIFTKNL